MAFLSSLLRPSRVGKHEQAQPVASSSKTAIPPIQATTGPTALRSVLQPRYSVAVQKPEKRSRSYELYVQEEEDEDEEADQQEGGEAAEASGSRSEDCTTPTMECPARNVVCPTPTLDSSSHISYPDLDRVFAGLEIPSRPSKRPPPIPLFAASYQDSIYGSSYDSNFLSPTFETFPCRYRTSFSSAYDETGPVQTQQAPDEYERRYSEEPDDCFDFEFHTPDLVESSDADSLGPSPLPESPSDHFSDTSSLPSQLSCRDIDFALSKRNSSFHLPPSRKLQTRSAV
ncbi:hypothetical protein P7C73_g3295, partial [Tremellales sp. Uapishka_1]